ncbi:Gfo/Idh/MocA family oxidoreductase [Paenibacillus sp. IB182496]|uniref:Gfo/Idh/MocA family oxidoreductase n=1 Tax=Paenibacillus sabuli TaxID=2772509 RepID=A0A927BZR4_9BACL|nr:Gfo/Idh/MocA family oxidoreductase [Paenibacillus sabuli]MBD2848273.1 Gfo/Idh/MocA family oxidoreductase [Paenibacillus sabuli]
MSKREIGIGIVGCGFFGREFARQIGESAGMRLAAVYGGRNAAETAREGGCQLAASVEALVAMPEVEAIVVASPNHLHREPVLLAAAAGKHVFCEKPIALTAAACAEMLAACREAGVVFMAGHILRVMPGIARLRERIEAGAIGRPIVGHAERTGWERPASPQEWKKDTAKSGGHLFHHIHELDLLIAIMGPVSRVYTAGGRLAHPEGLQDDVLLLTLEFAGGGVGTMQYGSGFRAGEHKLVVNGTEGYAQIDFQRSRIRLAGPAGEETFGCSLDEDQDRDRAALYERLDGGVIHGNPSLRPPEFLRVLMKREMEIFAEAARSGQTPAPLAALFDGSAALQSVAAAGAAMAALDAGAPVAVGADPAGLAGGSGA